MTITLNHTIVPAHDKDASARFFAEIFGLYYGGSAGHFAPVRVNATLTLDFDDAADFDIHHYASTPFSRASWPRASPMAASLGISRIAR
jgi:hypothetical protein